MVYELFCEGSVNVEATYRTRKQALDVLRQEYATRGWEYVRCFTLAHHSRRGGYELIADGDALAALVATADAHPNGRSSTQVSQTA
jgi:hypothetical protein